MILFVRPIMNETQHRLNVFHDLLYSASFDIPILSVHFRLFGPLSRECQRRLRVLRPQSIRDYLRKAYLLP